MTETVTHHGITATVIPLESCLAHVHGLIAAGRRWHSHVLSPGCMHNPYPDRYAVLIEDDTARQAFIAPSDAFPEVDKQLVRLLHGDDILDADKGGRLQAKDSAFLQRLLDFQARGVHWHHHMHFPACVLNPRPGEWAIAIESPEGTFHMTSADEPVDALREVEVLYFQNLEAARR